MGEYTGTYDIIEKNYYNSCRDKSSSIKCKDFEMSENAFGIETKIAA
jgi:hypothetical protein